MLISFLEVTYLSPVKYPYQIISVVMAMKFVRLIRK